MSEELIDSFDNDFLQKRRKRSLILWGAYVLFVLLHLNVIRWLFNLRDELDALIVRTDQDQYHKDTLLSQETNAELSLGILTFSHLVIILVYFWNNYDQIRNRFRQKRSRHFNDWPSNEQIKITENAFCEKCVSKRKTTFSHEADLDGFKVLYLSCSECGHEFWVRRPKHL